MSNVVDLPTVDFLKSITYLTKDEYLSHMRQLKKNWKKDYGKLTNSIRGLKAGERAIGYGEIGWRASHIYWNTDTTDVESIETMETMCKELQKFADHQGSLQSLRSNYSKEATYLIEQYMETRAFYKKCAHYSYVLDRMLEETNRRF